MVTQATKIWAYSNGLVPFADLKVGEYFEHPFSPGVTYVKTSKNGWYRRIDAKGQKSGPFRGNAGTAVKLVEFQPEECR